MKPYKGMLFRHAHFLDSDYSGRPLPCKVTRIASGVVYYRPFYGYHEDGSEWLGAPMYVPIEKFHLSVGMLGGHDATVGSAERRESDRPLTVKELKATFAARDEAKDHES